MAGGLAGGFCNMHGVLDTIDSQTELAFVPVATANGFNSTEIHCYSRSKSKYISPDIINFNFTTIFVFQYSFFYILFDFRGLLILLVHRYMHVINFMYFRIQNWCFLFVCC